MSRYCSIDELVGKTLREVIVSEDECITFVVNDNEQYRLMHHQDCCECVYIESIVGDVNDLVGTPILIAREVSGSDIPPINLHGDDVKPYDGHESMTWSFYCVATVKGYVDIRWVGLSNGYYSESVSFEKIED